MLIALWQREWAPKTIALVASSLGMVSVAPPVLVVMLFSSTTDTKLFWATLVFFLIMLAVSVVGIRMEKPWDEFSRTGDRIEGASFHDTFGISPFHTTVRKWFLSWYVPGCVYSLVTVLGPAFMFEVTKVLVRV